MDRMPVDVEEVDEADALTQFLEPFTDPQVRPRCLLRQPNETERAAYLPLGLN